MAEISGQAQQGQIYLVDRLLDSFDLANALLMKEKDTAHIAADLVRPARVLCQYRVASPIGRLAWAQETKKFGLCRYRRDSPKHLRAYYDPALRAAERGCLREPKDR